MNIATQVDRLKTVRKKRILKLYLVQESHFAKIRQSCSSDPFTPLPGRSWKRSLVHLKQLQPDYASSYK